MTEATARSVSVWWAERLERGDAARFEKELYDRLLPMEGNHIVIKTDYDPQGVLLEAMWATGIKCSGRMWSCEGLLPMKTITVVRGEQIETSEGRGVGFEVLR